MPTVVLLAITATTGGTLVVVATVIGVLAALVQLLGLLRWSYLVPWLARAHATASSPQERTMLEITFEAFHRFLGVGVGEHLGYLLTGVWSGLIGVAIALDGVLPAWLGWVGVPIGLGLVLGLDGVPGVERGARMEARRRRRDGALYRVVGLADRPRRRPRDLK